jgi:hypothetical protein
MSSINLLCTLSISSYHLKSQHKSAQRKSPGVVPGLCFTQHFARGAFWQASAEPQGVEFGTHTTHASHTGEQCAGSGGISYFHAKDCGFGIHSSISSHVSTKSPGMSVRAWDTRYGKLRQASTVHCASAQGVQHIQAQHVSIFTKLSPISNCQGMAE